ncbi:MAG: cytochrome c [Acidobacteria bacterium]|nr:cytochrome c [Acidobacteriota bacterium]MDA1235226.1 cytochrome c [Acidobacteriota bacterium]
MTIRKYLIPLILLALAAMPAAAQTVWDGVYTTEQAERGKDIYLSECVLCHGATMLGAEDGPAVTGEGFRASWDGRTADMLVERIRLTMPSDGPGFLSRAQSTDLTAYIFSDNGFPAGDAEMKSSLAALKKIVIKAEKD